MHALSVFILLLISTAEVRTSPLGWHEHGHGHGHRYGPHHSQRVDKDANYFGFNETHLPAGCHQVCGRPIECELDDGTWLTFSAPQPMHFPSASASATISGSLPPTSAVPTQWTSGELEGSSTPGMVVSTTPEPASSPAPTSEAQDTWAPPQSTTQGPNSAYVSSSTSSAGLPISDTPTSEVSPIDGQTTSTVGESPDTEVSATWPSTATGPPTSASSQTTASTGSVAASSLSQASTSVSSSTVSTGQLPSPSQFKADKGTRWNLQYIGNLSFANPLGELGVRGDNCRTAKIGDKVIWNCGDMMCGDDVLTCGFTMAPGYYGTDSMMHVDTAGKKSLQDFIKPWAGDPQPPEQYIWGEYSSNIAPINSTHGVVYTREYWRNGPGGDKDVGNAVSSVTLGEDRPIATRVGPLLTGTEAAYLGMLAIMRDGDYIYHYSGGGPSNIRISRVPASDDVFDITKYESLKADTENTWIPGVPMLGSMETGATTSNPGGKFACGGAWGSVVYNNYLAKYIMLCGEYMVSTNMHLADTPWGPWGPAYTIASGGNLTGSYGTMMHPEYSPLADGGDRSWYFSIGPNDKFYMYRVDFDY
ncbi:hypothetical protein PV08_07774 [Exophiala spinifera]|uniref:Uncharacterized protein n=1 Tax=Exophiala spinifera TaxID=91928 RepID=A0A0D1ZQE6_9EURO|nr:uncharacterized protein PV08_07774 [Exophiala spinifera]KIW14987.1 hypothetical protein PV08_07774 [Exophiala spinifera]